ncbi:hypothetical protein LY76DRAFT_587331 [Colletotrichum caudatum]|nr:hypothetical protein LY76DRAFT_587331 [Colletotrichum caudatum]
MHVRPVCRLWVFGLLAPQVALGTVFENRLAGCTTNPSNPPAHGRPDPSAPNSNQSHLRCIQFSVAATLIESKQPSSRTPSSTATSAVACLAIGDRGDVERACGLGQSDDTGRHEKEWNICESTRLFAAIRPSPHAGWLVGWLVVTDTGWRPTGGG